MLPWLNKETGGRVTPRRRVARTNERRAVLTKRRKFVIVSTLLTLGLLVIQRLSVESRYGAIAFFAIAAYCLTAWSMLKELRGVAWLTNLVLPTLYPTAVALFYFLLPQAPVTQMIVLLLFAVSMYGLLLTANIFAVASIRTIQLLRAARAVGFLLSILASAFLYHVIFSLHLPFYLVILLTYVVSYPLMLAGAWSYHLSDRIGTEARYALIGSLLVMEVAWGLSFWLIEVPLASIVLAMVMYVVLGLFQHDLEERLFARTVQEYLAFAGIVLLTVMISVLSHWAS
jgi:hypothetical protein